MRTTLSVLVLLMLVGCTQTATPPPAADQAKGGPGKQDGDDDQPILIATNAPPIEIKTARPGSSYMFGKNPTATGANTRKPPLHDEGGKKATFTRGHDRANWVEDARGTRIFIGMNWSIRVNTKHNGGNATYVDIAEEMGKIHVDLSHTDTATIVEDQYIQTDDIDSIVLGTYDPKFVLPVCLYYWNPNSPPPDNPCH